MHKRIALFLVILFAAGSQRALAESTRIDLDTAPGAFSVWKVSDLATSTVTFEFTFGRVRKDEQWAPTYAIALGDGKGQLLIFSGSYQTTYVPDTEASVTKDGKEVSKADSILKFELNETYKVKLAWLDGKVTATVNGVSKEYAVPFKPSEIRITCSTGELEVKDIVFE